MVDKNIKKIEGENKMANKNLSFLNFVTTQFCCHTIFFTKKTLVDPTDSTHPKFAPVDVIIAIF